MTPITTVRAQLPCPTCGVLGPLTVTVRAPSPTSECVEAGASRGLPGGSHSGIVSDCTACWARRADRIAAARHRLQATGELTSLGPGREDAWLGVPLSRCEEDFENAFASALMKTPGEPTPAPRQVQALKLRTLDPAATEPELVGV